MLFLLSGVNDWSNEMSCEAYFWPAFVLTQPKEIILIQDRVRIEKLAFLGKIFLTQKRLTQPNPEQPKSYAGQKILALNPSLWWHD